MLSPDQAHIHTFKVLPSLPEPLRPLMEIAHNLWWTWRPDAVDLFKQIDPAQWHQTNHNPVRLLGLCPQARLEELAADQTYLNEVRRVHSELKEHLSQSGWFAEQNPEATKDFCAAYFCAEFGLTESLPIYSGGLGILAGDHLKSASELGVPLVGVGLLYRNGYFQQYLNADGWQQEFYPELDFANLPIRPLQTDAGEKLTIAVQFPGRTVQAAVWEAHVGRVRLLLLDTNLQRNQPEDREITSQLYGGDMEMRIKQEIVLGIGGMRALETLGLRPSVLHMNEGHAAFLALEHIRMLIEEHDISFDEAARAAGASHVFTTHTPVPAGIDRFPPEMIKRYFKEYHGSLKLDMEGLLALGREDIGNKNEFFSMAVLALRTSDAANGVSRLHGEVSREMWDVLWPRVPNEEVPIGHITNGVHARSWINSELIDLFDKHLPSHWQTHPSDQSVWEGIEDIPDNELWQVHKRRRHKLVEWVRRTRREQLEHRGANSVELEKCDTLLDPHALTIGFARRFATYKRANLLLRDPERLARILTDPDRPVQIVIAGKAHPADTQGKELIRQLVHFAREHGAHDRLVFVENYNIAVARYLVQGVDVWLNTPRRGLEASGTSGMKAMLNGVLNCSILDGWWDEAWRQDVGWAIGSGESYTNYDYQDQVESQALYDLLEEEIVPMFYHRDEQGLPLRWIQWMKNTMRMLAPWFTTNRMVRAYVEHYYIEAHNRGKRRKADNLANARELSHHLGHLRERWDDLRVEHIEAEEGQPVSVRQPLEVSAVLHLGRLQPGEVRPQVYYGPLDSEGRIVQGEAVDMTHGEDLGEARHRFVGQLKVGNSGRYGFAVRVLPQSDELATPFEPGLIVWDTQSQPTEHSTEEVSAAS